MIKQFQVVTGLYHREGPENETSTNDIVSKMTNFIKENSFELTFDGMNIKFTSLQVSLSPARPLVWLIFRRGTFITSPSCMTGVRTGIFSHSSQESSMFSQVQVRISPSWQSSVFSDLWAGNISLSQPLDIVLLAGKSSLELMVLIRNVSYCSTSVPINKRVLRKYFEPPSVTKTCHISFNLLPRKLSSHKYNLNRKYVWALQK